MSEAVPEETAMASLNAAKKQLRAAMKHKLSAVSHSSIVSQSTTRTPAPSLDPTKYR